jgi:hypothetical protein
MPLTVLDLWRPRRSDVCLGVRRPFRRARRSRGGAVSEIYACASNRGRKSSFARSFITCPVRLKVAVSGLRLQWTLQCPELACESLLGRQSRALGSDGHPVGQARCGAHPQRRARTVQRLADLRRRLSRSGRDRRPHHRPQLAPAGRRERGPSNSGSCARSVPAT